MSKLYTGPDGNKRCQWTSAAPEFIHYHDTEWGFAVDNDIRLFEKICLESFQSGLSWRTILAKREHFRTVFDGFDYVKVAQYDEQKIAELLADAGIVRHRGKVEAVINNAQQALDMEQEFGTLSAYFWQYEAPPSECQTPQTQSTSATSAALAKDLKKRGWKFVGPTTAFAFMQAMGLINDHAVGCICRDKAAAIRAKFAKPVPT